MQNLDGLTAREALGLMRQGICSAEQLSVACLRQTERREQLVGAWSYLDPQQVLAQARQADQRLAGGEAAGLPLNGVPVGVKDIFDTADMPTENGTIIHSGRRPTSDCAVVERLRRAGAVIMGKTVTAELAVYAPGKTTNPHDPARTPGGSSSGSAAAVSAGMVPLAVGTQTNGSVIRPASYCGVVGYKPSFGSIPRAGILRQSPSLDQVGVFARTVADSALLASVLMGRQLCHGDTLPWPQIDAALLDRQNEAPPRLAFVKTPVWQQASEQARSAYLAALSSCGNDITEIVLPAVCAEALSCHRTIMLSEMAHHYRELHREHGSSISPMLLKMLEQGRLIALPDYLEARNLAAEITASVEDTIGSFDAVLTPAVPSEAPLGLTSTGSPIFCTIWSLCGTPAVSLPVLTGAAGMPLGLQLVGTRGADMRLLHAAQWLETRLRLIRRNRERKEP